MKRAIGAAALALLGADAARMRKGQRSTAMKGAKFIAGVPILNYYVQPAGRDSLAQKKALDEDWIVVVKPGVSDEQIHEACSMSKCVREGHPSKGGVPYFEIRATEDELARLLKQGGEMVKFIERDAEVRLIPEIKSDVQASTSWGLDRIGAPLRATEGAGAHVYVLDTGIRATHTDYGGRVTPALDMTEGSMRECNGALDCAGDVQGHGSHCAGTAAGNTYGVAPAASIYSVKVLSDQGSGSWSWSYDALDWLATKANTPAVASMSLGGSGTQSAMADAVDAAVNSGVTVVVAGGNDNSNACGFSPAFVPSAITVGSTTSNDYRSSFSNYGECTDIWAPGSDITSVGVSDDHASATYSGTSMACPHISGGAALILGLYPEKKSEEVLQDLLDNAVVNAISDLQAGDVNYMLYVGAGGPPPTPVPVPTPAPVNFKCNDGCDISDSYLNDGYCDCIQCEDEDTFTCSTCSGGCPTYCGGYTSCAATPAPTPAPDNYKCDDGCDIADSYVNDGFCDCTNCEDEQQYTCSTCSGGCPSTCGAWTNC